MISTPRSFAVLGAILVSLASSPALAQGGRGLGSPTGEPTGTPAPRPTPAPESSPAPPAPDAPAQPAAPSPASPTPGEPPPALPERDVPGAPVAPEAEPPEPPLAPGSNTGEDIAPGSNTGEDIAPPSEAIDPASGDAMRLVVIDAATFGIDAVVGQVASARMRATGEEMGYQVLTQEETIASAQQLRMPYPPTPADLWRVSWVARAQRGAFARIWAHGGQYVIEITVASLDGGGPFFARGTAGAEDLREVVDRLLRTALPPPSAWNAGGAAPPATAATPPRRAVDELDDDEPARRRPSEPEPELRRWQLTLQTEGAIGAAQEVFYNHLVGLRFDFRITRNILLGVYAAYVNLNARDGRADNILIMGQFENRIRISPDLDLTIPLRVAAGYLPFNGPVVRLAAGLNYAVSESFEIGADILAPTFWILPDRTAVSLNIAIEGTYRF